MTKHIQNNYPYPYLPKDRGFKYVPASNPFMEAAKAASLQSLDSNAPNGSVVVKNGQIVASGTNGSTYHLDHPCVRVLRGIPTGQGYELCEGCHPKNHSEAKALADAEAKRIDPAGSDIYLWGHWWCCEPCWNAMIGAGIRDVYLMEGSYELFGKPRTKTARESGGA
jgi:deoxycytidylate deaminase